MAKAGAAKVALSEPREQASDLRFFLTAYDPSDLPGMSVDPLGFERGYLFLGDKLLPGLTNVAAAPRYFSVLCAGAYLAEVETGAAPQALVETRREAIMRLERLWGLACALAAREDDVRTPGLRGISYVRHEITRLDLEGAKVADADYKLLSRQAPYGALGIYGAISESLRLLDRSTYALSPGAGEVLAMAFLDETEAPPGVRKAIQGGGECRLDKLAEWGHRAFVGGDSTPTEAKILASVFTADPVRRRMLGLLAKYEHDDNGNANELARLGRIAEAIGHADDGVNQDIRETIHLVRDYERCYQLALLGFERLLFLCGESAGVPLSSAAIAADSVMKRVSEDLPPAVQALEATLAAQVTSHVGRAPAELEDALRFLRLAADADGTVAHAQRLIGRHREIQQGKFDRGRRKLPWLEEVPGGLSLTSTRVGGLQEEATTAEDIRPHPYRLVAADQMIRAARLS